MKGKRREGKKKIAKIKKKKRGTLCHRRKKNRFLFCCCCFFFRATPAAYGPRLRVTSELQSLAYTIITQDPSCVRHLPTAQSNAKSLTHRSRPGIKLESSWILVRFINCEVTMGIPSPQK